MKKEFTSIYDENGNPIYLDDKVELSCCKISGTVSFISGAYGIEFEDTIDWNRIYSQIPIVTGCDNTPCFCDNDNFISFWELMWNFNCEGACCNVVRKVVETFETLRKETIKKHRKMWNWIADNQEELGYLGSDMKYEYLSRYERKELKLNCYLCDYKHALEKITCEVCPLDWKSDQNCPCMDTDVELEGLYARWLWTEDIHEAARLAREIANLPEKTN